MAKNVNHVSHIKSTSSAITSGNSVFIADGKAGPKLPVASTLIQGEIAVNLAKDVETLSIVNTSGEIVTFSSDKIIKKVIVDNEQVTSAALNDLEERKQNKLTAGDGITINDDVISATASISPVDLPISGGSATDYSQNDVPSAGSVLDRFLADEGRMSEIEVVTSAALNDLNSRVSTVSGDVETLKTSVANKVDNSTYAAYTASTQTILNGKQGALTAGDNITITSDNVISATDTTYTAGEGISISSSNVISNTAITVVDVALDSGSTNPVANSAVTKAISDLTVEVRNNELVDAAALNDLNSRKLDASAITGYATEEWVTNQGYLTEHQSLSGYATTAVTNQLRNDVNTLSGNSITGASYNSTTKKIEFTTSTGKTIEVDATAFIKDGMVDKVAVSGVASGGSTVECLVVTFNTDAGKENINIPLSLIFDSNQYYTKTEIDNKLGSGFTGSNSGVTVTQAINDSEKVVAAALNDLNNRKLDASAITGYATEEWVEGKLGSGFTGDTLETVTDAFNFAFEEIGKKADTTWVEEKLGSGFTGDNSGNTVTKVIEENELVVAAALNDLNSRKLDVSALTEIQEAISDKQDALSAGTNITIEDNVISAAEYVAGSGITISGANNEVSVKIVELQSGATYADDEIPSAKSVKQTIVDNELVVASALNDLEERKLDASAFTETAAALETLSGEVASKELVVAASLNDLNSRLIEVSGDVEDNTSAISGLYDRINTLDPEVVKVVTGLPSIGSSGISTSKIYLVKNDSSTESGTSGNVYTEYVYVSGQTGGNRWEKIGEWKPEMSVDAALSSSSTNPVQNKVVKSAIDNKQDKLTEGSGITIDSANTISVNIDVDSDAWSSGSTGVPATSALAEVLEEIEEVTATALNDLNDRLTELEDTPDVYVSGGSYDTTNGVLTLNQANGPDVNVTIQAGGSSGGEANVITGVSVNGSAITLTNKVANITSVPASIVSTSSTLNFVSSTEKNTWNNKQNAFSNASTLSGISATNVTNWNAVTAKTDTTAFTQHTGNTTIHVTSAEKTQWNNAISGVSVNGSAVTVTNNVATISGVSLEPLVINIGINDTTVPNGTYAAITAALADNRQVILRCNVDNQQFEYSYLTGDGTNLDEGYYFIGFGISTTEINFANISSSNTLTLDTMEYASASHTHGNITTYGKLQTSDITIANGDKLVVTDASDNSGRVARASVTFDGSTTNKALTPKGTWEAFSLSGHTHAISDVTNLQSTLDGKVSGITMNSAAKTVTNGVVDLGNVITAETTLSTASTGTGSVVTGLTVNNHQITMQKGNVTLDNVADGTTRKLSNYATTGTVNTLNNTVTAHTGNSDIHVTAANKTQWNNAISGVSFNGATATVSNHVAAITATIPAAPGTLTTTATTAQSTATNEALSGNIALHKVSKTGSYSDLTNKPTIPAAANNATITLQFGNSSSAFTVNASSNLTINLATLIGIPAPTASDNGKILGVVNGQFAWITPTTIYTGTGTPQTGTGNDGDIYLQTS